MEITRRSFLKGTVAAAAALGTSGLSFAFADDAEENAEFASLPYGEAVASVEEETDVVVVGIGVSGTTAAAGAADKGCKVIAIDRAFGFAGTNNVNTTGAWHVESSEQVKYEGYVTKKEAFEMISSYSGRTHYVYTGVTIIYKRKEKDEEYSFVDKAAVTVSEMTNCEIKAYVETGEPMDKAGAYGIQGAFCKYIPKINGDFYTVMGLPIARTYRAIKEMTR